jgi:hypothetical protein
LPNGKSVPQLARERTPAAIELLADVVEDPTIELQTRIAAAHALLRCGHADAPRNGEDPTPITVVVQRIDSYPPRPTPGILNHPDPRWIALPSVPQADPVSPVGSDDVTRTP